MEKLKYAETVIKEVHSRTTRGELQWTHNQRSVSAQPTPAIRVSINYVDDGPDAATWEYVVITHPVGTDLTVLGNPSSPKATLFAMSAADEMLDQLNEIFRRILLEPRKSDFEVAMKKLHEA